MHINYKLLIPRENQTCRISIKKFYLINIRWFVMLRNRIFKKIQQWDRIIGLKMNHWIYCQLIWLEFQVWLFLLKYKDHW
jgi:hypothetical protein